MNVEDFREYCLQKQHVEESFPFDETTLVFKLNNKIFALLSLNDLKNSCNLKCDPEKALELDRKSTRLNSSHVRISYAVFCLKKKKKTTARQILLSFHFSL